MRRLVAAMLIGGCYAPSAPAGAPCDPLATRCPAGQSCQSVGGAYVCTTGAGDADAALADATPDDVAAMVDAAAVQQIYTATVAECINPALPDPAACRTFNGNTELVIDTRDSTTDEPWQSFIRFDIDAALQGKTITSVILRLVATDDDKADGSDTGAIWRVSPFTLASLGTTAPTKLDAAALAGTQGAVVALDVVDWSLPANVVTPNSPVYLGLYAGDDDGVNYWNLDGTTPPRLVIGFE